MNVRDYEAERQERIEEQTEELLSRMLLNDQLRNIPTDPPLIDGLLYLNQVAVLYGPSGSGKTFLSVDLAMTVASKNRTMWNGHEVTPGDVLYVIAEGATGMSTRVDAWLEHYGDLGNLAWWLPEPVNMFDDEWADTLSMAAKRVDAKLIVIDTLARSIVGAEENSAKDMGLVVDNVHRLREATGACVLLVHHSGKSSTSGARGSSALRAGVDTEIEVEGDIHAMRVKNTKQKHAAEATATWLGFKPVLESGVLTMSANAPVGGMADTLDVLRELQIPGGVGFKVWKDAAGLTDGTMGRHLSKLIAGEYVINVGSDKVPKYLPADYEE
jgi:hypothetical protein